MALQIILLIFDYFTDFYSNYFAHIWFYLYGIQGKTKRVYLFDMGHFPLGN